VYCLLAKEQFAHTLRYLDHALSLCIDSLPVLAPVLTLMLKALLCSYQADHHTALELLRQALHVLKRGEDRVEKEGHWDWLWGVKAVLLHNLAGESMNVYLRSDAVQYVIRAAAVVEQHSVADTALRTRILIYKGKLVPPALDTAPTLTTSQSLKTVGETHMRVKSASNRNLRSRSALHKSTARARPPLSGRIATVT